MHQLALGGVCELVEALRWFLLFTGGWQGKAEGGVAWLCMCFTVCWSCGQFQSVMALVGQVKLRSSSLPWEICRTSVSFSLIANLAHTLDLFSMTSKPVAVKAGI